LQIAIPLLDIQMRVDVVERHDAVGARHQPAVHMIDDVVDRHQGSLFSCT
jgi:hypothetical protein